MLIRELSAKNLIKAVTSKVMVGKEVLLKKMIMIHKPPPQNALKQKQKSVEESLVS